MMTLPCHWCCGWQQTQSDVESHKGTNSLGWLRKGPTGSLGENRQMCMYGWIPSLFTKPVATLFVNWLCMLSHFSRVRLLWPLGPQPARLLWPWSFPGKNTRIDCHFLLQGSFPSSQGWNPHHLYLLHCRQILFRRATGEALLGYTRIQNKKLGKKKKKRKGPTIERYSWAWS